MHAEEEEMADEDKEEAVQSVFDGAKQQFFNARFKGTTYRVDREKWTYETKEGETGAWDKQWSMPEEEFKKRRPIYLQRFKAKKRKLRIKMGMGQRHPNGRLVFLDKLRRSPFVVELYGEKYKGKAAWLKSPNEIANREQQLRAKELRRRLMQEKEEERVRKLRALNVWLGDPSWQRPWQGDHDEY